MALCFFCGVCDYILEKSLFKKWVIGILDVVSFPKKNWGIGDRQFWVVMLSLSLSLSLSLEKKGILGADSLSSEKFRGLGIGYWGIGELVSLRKKVGGLGIGD